MTIPDYDEGVNTYPEEREMSVAERLASVRCEAAPFGWSDRLADGSEVIDFREDGGGEWVGYVRFESGCLMAVNWDHTGEGSHIHGVWNLVPLPDPTTKPERIEYDTISQRQRGEAWDDVCDCLSRVDPDWLHLSRGSGSPLSRAVRAIEQLASERDESRKTIVKQAAEIERLKQDIQHERDVEVAARSERDAAIDIARRLRYASIGREYRAACEMYDAKYSPTPATPCDPLPERSETLEGMISRQAETIDRLTQERDAAIDIGHKLRSCFDGNPKDGLRFTSWEFVREACGQFDELTERYGDSHPTPCDHLPITEPEGIDDPANTLKAYRVRGTTEEHFTLGESESRGGKVYRRVVTAWVDEATIEPWTGVAQ